ncbi:MAG: DEAD/DEAH box helicase [Bacteroidales bacterium]|nr:DEAD/DEAH box helicase [Bacteroidales bacterium]
MISISFDSAEDFLHITISGNNFRDLVDFVKLQGCKWDPDLKCWTLSITKFDDFKAAAKSFDDVDIDMLTLSEVERWKSTLVELELYRRAFKQELLTFPPLQGKPPYEDYQIADITRGICQNRFLFHHEMGLGKSYILTALIEHKRLYGDIYKCLIFSTPIGTRNLKSELLKHGKNMKEDDIITFTSAGAIPFEDRDIFNTEKYPQTIIILSYDALKSVSNYYYDKKYGTKTKKHPSTGKNYRANCMPIKEWLGGRPGGLFLDENHSLAVPSSRRTQVMNWIVPYFNQRFLFTGTLADKYEKLYEPCWILDKALVGGMDYQTWCATYNELGNKFSAYAINPDKWDLIKLEQLNIEMMKKYCSKREMLQCLDLPLNYEVPTIYCDMSPLQRKIYERFSNFTAQEQSELAGGGGKSFSERMVNLFQYLQGAVDNPTCLQNSSKFENFPEDLKQDILKFDWNKHSAKAEIVDDIVEERSGECGEKGIIWYFHPQTKDALVERYKKYNPAVISADVPMDDRVGIINNFLKDPKQKLIIASINVMNTSVTLIECKYEVYVEKTYNFVVYTQSRGRLFRPGQKDITRTYSMRYDNSLDNLQELNLKSKGETLNSLFNQQYISANVWKKLFSLQKGQSI